MPDCPLPIFRHSGWHNRRQRTYDALVRTGQSTNRTARFARCGSSGWVLQHDDDPRRFRYVRDFCHDRFCIPCSRARAWTIRRNLARHVGDHPHRFLTLTLAPDHRSLADRVDRLLKSFKRLRAKQFWKDKVRGGAAFLEVTHGKQADHWHPHLHVILDGKYISVHLLRSEWLAITGDSHVLRLELIRESGRVRDYVAGYATKALPSDVVATPHQLDEAVTALVGRKTAYTFGTWSRWRLLAKDAEPGWHSLGHVNLLLGDNRAIDQDILELLLRVARQHPDSTVVELNPNILPLPPPDTPDPPPNFESEETVWTQHSLHFGDPPAYDRYRVLG